LKNKKQKHMISGVHLNKFQGEVHTKINRPDKSVIAKIAAAYSGFVLDHLGKTGYLKGIRPLQNGIKICGPAVTSLGPDLSVRRMAIDLAQEGDVLVVANNGITDYSCFGDGTALRMKYKKMAGCVIDGATRDSGRLRDLGFPTFAAGVTPRNYHYPVSAEYGGVNVPVVVAGVLVNPGDILIGDDDGVVVIPREMAEDMSLLIEKNLEEEIKYRAAMTSFVPFDVRKELEDRGYTFF
jgi:4-hydroxy-4-methyl-2-oxoglutarate aldolase